METIQPSKKISFLQGRFHSIHHAANGISRFIRTEKNAGVHLTATILVTLASILLPVNRMELLALIPAVSFVWITEMINTALEKTLDFISVERNETIKFIKDVAAGAVLLASIAAVLTGIIIFLPKILAI